MANEIHVDYAAGNTLYAIIRNPLGQVWYPAGEAFENWGADGHSANHYAIALLDKSMSRYVGDIDTNIPAGQYSIQWFIQAGASPADNDTLAGSRDITWTGVAELTATQLLANRAVHNTLTGLIEFYDDESTGVIFSQTLTDAASVVTRAREFYDDESTGVIFSQTLTDAASVVTRARN
jgi:hypothetical protein